MTERHFRVVQLANKKVEIGGVSITSKASPGSAARKLLTSIAHEKGLKKNKKVSMGKVTFSIQEYTQGSSKKVYGPYVGHFHKYTAAELKKAKTAGGKVKFTMKPVVKLAKKNMKGGACPARSNNLLLGVANDFHNSTVWNDVELLVKTKINKFAKDHLKRGSIESSERDTHVKVAYTKHKEDTNIFKMLNEECLINFINKFGKIKVKDSYGDLAPLLEIRP